MNLGSRCGYLLLVVACILLSSSVCHGDTLILSDPLQGSTTGTRSGGQFVTGGWQVTAALNYIFWHLPYAVQNGKAEFDIKGINPNECRVPLDDKTDIFHMYDWTYENADTNYTGYRNNPYKHFIRKIGCNGGSTDAFELLFQILPNYTEPDSSVLSWNPATTYHMMETWGPDGSGNCVMKTYRDGALLKTMTVPGTWNPAGHSVRIGDAHPDYGAPIDAIYSNVKVWLVGGSAPGTPSVTTPANGATVRTRLVYIAWTGDSHTSYQVRVNTANDPSSGIAWDSGEVTSARDWAWTGALSDLTNYYVFVRIGNSTGWSDWSAAGRWFRVDTSATPGQNLVKVWGNSMVDNDGPFLGLGFTYMQALRRCKYDRTRYRSDLAFMSARGYKYQRILTMVGWYTYWDGYEIAPINFYNEVGKYVAAWPDYWQQFRDMIDIAYDDYGIRSEVTIFADAQLMPNSSDRYTHMDNVLANLVGREHKVMHLEVANEYWQNGFPDPGGVDTVRAFGQYLADRTSIPVALSDGDLAAMYQGSAADIATEHFSRDISTSEGGWLPVRDCWDAVLIPGIPPISSNEPIGPGSSVNTENDPIKLVSAACFAWTAGLPLYVFHSDAGVKGLTTFESKPGVSDYRYLDEILPPDLPSWVRNDGKEASAPFTAYCMGQANKYWTDVGGATNGCHRNIGAVKGSEFVTYCQGILSGGVTLEARTPVRFKVYNPMTGAVVLDTSKGTGDQFTLAQGPQAYIIVGTFSSQASLTLNVKEGASVTIDGSSADWNLGEFSGYVRGGESGSGDIALVGYDGGTLYYGGYCTTGVLPTSAADHTAKVYSRHDGSYLYFLVRCDDSDVRYAYGVDSNWANDCVEFYIDPSNDGGSSAMSDSTSDIQLVIDANNQKNVYMTTAGYRTQILSGVTSAVVRDGTGWWLEARIAKTVLDPDLSSSGNFGIDFNFRDNDNNNDAGQTTVYTWSDNISGAGFPSKIPNQWGEAVLLSSTCFSDAFTYSNGNLNGNGGWSGTATSQIVVESNSVKIVGGAGVYYADQTVSCTGSGGVAGVWLKAKKGVGAYTMWSLYVDDPAGNNIARWYGMGTTARGRIGGGAQVTSSMNLTGTSVWDDLYVRIDFVANTSQFFFNGTSIGVLNHAEFGAGDSIGRLRFERTDNASAAGNYLYLDDLKVGVPDITAPSATIGSPSIPITKTGPVNYSANFSEPVYGFNSSSDIQLNSTGGATAGSVVVTGSGAGPYTVSLSSISGSGTLGITVKSAAANDVAGIGNTVSSASATFTVVGSDGRISDVKDDANGSPVTLGGKALYLSQAGFGYIEELDRTSGIRVEGALAGGVGDLVVLSGVMGTKTGGERYVLVGAMAACGTGSVDSLGLNNRALIDAMVCGLYVKAWGKVKPGSITGNSYFLTDGSDDAGIKVITPGAPGVSENEFVTVVGAAGLDGVRVVYKL